MQSVFYEDDENLLGEDASTPTNTHPPAPGQQQAHSSSSSYLMIGENMVRTASVANEADAPASPVGTSTDGVMMMQYQIKFVWLSTDPSDLRGVTHGNQLHAGAHAQCTPAQLRQLQWTHQLPLTYIT
ncbi:hypothetical protein HELRODRAFT_166073 [Helobdella robusta]|uniref:Uncharacterized protein n=1 Tax=Helobdella robusta TaxID=6412 RepID=T1EXP5_HELRO|nr:hypothetical protein HELRODRAFT_166073 [Helobdella robusta]ESN90407.1 hypothetical protein HELRODRAFT_166073 [Helobdella robusta]